MDGDRRELMGKGREMRRVEVVGWKVGEVIYMKSLMIEIQGQSQSLVIDFQVSLRGLDPLHSFLRIQL